MLVKGATEHQLSTNKCISVSSFYTQKYKSCYIGETIINGSDRYNFDSDKIQWQKFVQNDGIAI